MLIATVTAITLAGCGDASDTGEEWADSAHVRLTSPSVNLQEIDVCWTTADGSVTAITTEDELIDGSSTRFLSLPVHEGVSVKLVPAGASCEQSGIAELDLGDVSAGSLRDEHLVFVIDGSVGSPETLAGHLVQEQESDGTSLRAGGCSAGEEGEYSSTRVTVYSGGGCRTRATLSRCDNYGYWTNDHRWTQTYDSGWIDCGEACIEDL